METPIGGKHGVAEFFSLGDFQMDPGSGVWKEFWTAIGEWAPSWGTGG